MVTRVKPSLDSKQTSATSLLILLWIDCLSTRHQEYTLADAGYG
jgi:hypothetical protein